jgi:serine/threonine protein kinase
MPVALKVLHAEASGQLERFAREGRLLSGLQHRCIVRFISHGFLADGRPYLVMEWLDGESLSERLERELLTIGETLDMALGVAEALGAAHAKGVVHRDLKPGNVFLVDADIERIKLLDFGIASARGSQRELTDTRTVLGTPGYMAPEQLKSSKDASAPADVFSLGCVMFKCLTGSIPFEGSNTLDVVLSVMTRPPLPITALRSDATKPLEALMSRMLAREPAKRPGDGTALARLIRQLIEEREGDGVGSYRPPSRGSRSSEPTEVTRVASSGEVVDDD